ncbi:MAG TPA: hypothetical protein VGO80_16220 [Solirubrobacteraceae bacterium]|jgi:hypothetical protein|nr:hypothetical protein [Solirubrobacteraceae bacterium]
MKRTTGARRRTLRGAIAAALAATAAATFAGGGCGDDFANEPRQPSRVTVSTVITSRGVAVSPRRLRAGPIALLASNQTAMSQRLQLRSRRLAPGGRSLAQTTGPISPGGTASLTADVDAGTYVVSVRSPRIQPARVVVGARRARGRDGPLQP